MRFKLVRMCKGETVTIIPMEAIRLDLDKASSLLKESGYEVSNPGVMVTATKNDLNFTLYKSGRILLSPSVEKEEAEKLAGEFYEVVERAKV